MNLMVWMTGLGISWLIFRIGRLVIDGTLALVPPFFFIAACYPTNYSLSHHWIASFLFLLMLLCLAASVSHAADWTPRRHAAVWFFSGVIAAATVVTMQPKGAVALILGPIYLLLAGKFCGGQSWGASLRAALSRGLIFAAGFAAAFVAVALFFVSQHAGHDWLYDNFTFLVTGYWPYVNPNGSFWYALTHPMISLAEFPSVTTFLFAVGYYFFMVTGPAAVLAGAFRFVPALRGAENVRARLILLLVIGSCGAYASEFHSLDLMHFVIGGILVLPVLLAMCQSAARRNSRARKWLISAGLVAAIFAILGCAWQVLGGKMRNTAVATRRGTVYETPGMAAALRERLNAIESRVPEGGETFFFMYDASFYFLSATQNPTRFDNLIPEFHTPAQFNEVEKALQQRRPGYVFDLSQEEGPTETIVVIPHPLETWLLQPGSPYHLDKEVAAMKIWALKK